MQTVEGNVTRFERLGLEDGLSEAQILAILQDSQGFLWIGTQDGLNKYDGYTFTVYRPDPTNPASLSTKVIHEIREDAEGDLWLGTDRGLERFDKRSEVFTPYQFDQKAEPASGQNLVRTILSDAHGALWIGTVGQGLYRLERRTGRWTVYQHDPEDPHSLASNNVTALLADAHGTLWVGTHGGGLGRLDRQTGEFTVYRHREEDPQSLSSNNVTALGEDGHGILWIGTETAGLNALDTAARVPTFARYQHEQDNPHSLSHNHVMALLVDTTGTLWVGTGRGLNELDGARNGFRKHHHEEGDPLSLSHSEILSLAEDAQGILWIGTRLGLSKFDRTTRAFGHFKRDPHTQGALSSNAVSAFLEDAEGYLWIGTYGGGLNRSVGSDTLTGFLHFAHREEDPHSLADRRALPSADRPVLLGDNAVLALCRDARERLWIGTRAGLHKLEPGDDLDSPPTFVRYQHERDDPGSLSHDLVLALADDGKGHLWVGTYGGLNRLDLADTSQGFVRHLHDENDPHSISHDFIRTIYVDSADSVWIGTNGGLNRLLHAEDSKFVRYQHDSQDPHSLSHDRVYCIAEGAQGILWVGTDGGLNRFDPQTERFTAYREQHGLSNDVVIGLLVDDHGCLWLANNKGIDHFDPTTERFTHHDVYDGVQANEFTQGAFYKDRLGRLYFGGFNGFNVFCPDNIRENTYEPPVMLTSLLLANKPVPISEAGPLQEHVNFAQQIELGPEDYVFAFEFSALNYRQPHKNRFAYMLEGFDRDWIYTGARDRKAVYTNVPPGTYTFRVKAANDDGLWNEEGRSVQVTVSQPWWHILFRSTFEAVIIHDGESILQVNQAALELLGYEQPELIGQSIYKLVLPEGRAQVAQHVSTGDETPYEATGLRKDGSAFVAEIRGRAIPYQGRVLRVAAVRDITERKRAEEALRQSQEFLQAALDSLSAHIAILDGEGTIVTVNASWCRFADQNGLGWEDYGVGRNYLAATDSAIGDEAQSARQVVTGIREVMAGQRPQFWLQYPCHSPEEQRWFEMRVTRFETPLGVQVAVAHEDITERREAEARLRTLSRAVEQSDSTIVVTDLEGTIEFVNPAFARITGYTAEEAMGQNPRILKSGRMPKEVYADLWGTITRGEVWEGELLNKKKDGEYYWEWAIISPVRDGEGNPSHYVAVKQDISARKQAEQALKEAHDELEQRVQARTAELNEAVERLRREVDQRQAAEAETRAQLVIQQGLATISARLMQAADFEQAITDVLAETGALLGAARVFLVRLRTDGQAVHRIYEWCASAFSPLCDHAEGWTVDGISWWLEELRRRGWFYFEDISGLPEQLQVSTPFSGGNAAGTYCAIPVYARHEMIGLLGCEGLAPAGEDLDKHRRVLEVVVGILSSAWLREQVLETLDQRIAARTRELSTFFDLTTLAMGAQDLADMLDPIPGRILELALCDAMCVHLLDAEGTTLALAAHGNLPAGARQQLEAIALKSDFAQRVKQLGDSMVVTGQVDASPLPWQLRLEGFMSYLGVPIPGGWVSYHRSSADGFSLDESSLLLALAEQIGVSVENHRLRQRIEAAVTLEERGRLARDLHDSVTQSLYSLSLFARSGRDAFEEGDTPRLTSSLDRLESTALQSLREMRLLLYELRPEALDQEGLVRTLERRFDTVERRAGVKAAVAYQAPDGLELPQAVERDLYYLIMEALNNTLKHGLASEVAVAIWVSPTQVRVEVADDGCGFDPQQTGGGYGLGDMRDRVERLGGRLEVSSKVGAGTRIRAWVDLPTT